MRVSIEPIAVSHRDGLVQLLGPFGLPAEIVDWKYYDREPGACRGFVWVRHGQVLGSIGVIPFTLEGTGGGVAAAWSCDWVVHAPDSNPGGGIFLLKEAMKAVDPLFSLGGNENNRRLMPRIAAAAVENAAVEWSLPLRVGGAWWFDGIERRSSFVADRLRTLWLPRGGGRTRQRLHEQAVVVDGVSREIELVLEEVPCTPWTPRYDLAYLRWQLERCPAVTCHTVFVPRSRRDAAAVIWCPRKAPLKWRVAWWGEAGASEDLPAVLATCARQAHRAGGVRLSAIAGEAGSAADTLRGVGFTPRGDRRALYVMTSGHPEVSVGLNRYSFLDADLAYRF